MNLYPSAADVTPHIPAARLSSTTCPSCGQELPADRLEELTGRIAAREREQAQALTSRLSEQFRAEKAAADAKAKAELEQERRDGAAREQRAVQAAREIVEAQFQKALADAHKQAAAAQTQLQVHLDASMSAQAQAERQRNQLNITLAETQRANAEQLARVQADAAARETSLRESLGAEIERTVNERLATTQAAHQKQQQAVQEQLAQAQDAMRTAQQQQSALQHQLSELRTSTEAQIATMKTTAEQEAARARQETAEQTAASYNNLIKEKDAELEAAQKASQEANQQLLALAAGQEKTLTEQLNAQREILEKDKDDAVNAEKARAFDENQKLSTKVNQLQRDLEKKTNEELGEGAELDLYEALRTEFPGDNIRRTPRGVAGADVHHEVMQAGNLCGVIIYDSKNHKQWRTEHASKLRLDQIAAKADHAILSTQQFPQGTRQLAIREGVVLANPARVVALATLFRQQIVQLHMMRVSSVEREAKTAKLYGFITSERFSQLISRVEEKTATLQKEQEKEMKFHSQLWKHQGECFQAILKAKGDLEHEIRTIISVADDDTTEDSAGTPDDSDEIFEFFK